MSFSILLLALLVSSVAADFSPSFRSFINSTYGPEMLAALARTDIGDIGSYGGGSHVGNSATSKRPIILVHGATNTAASFALQRDYFMSHGWSAETVYGTTYGDGGVTDVLHVKMLCEYVQQVRNMIEVVHAFTQQKVDVVDWDPRLLGRRF